MRYYAIDIETDDPGLHTFGPGAIRHYGKVLSVGVYSPEFQKTFSPDDPQLADILADSDICKILHNGIYDLDWLVLGCGLKVVGPIRDTMIRETLLDAYCMSYSLDSCCARHGVQGKNKGETIDDWWKRNGGKGKAIEHLAEIPLPIVNMYMMQDCHATYDLYWAQQPLLEEQDLLRCERVESNLWQWQLETKKNGMIVDWKARQALSDMMNDELDTLRTDFVKKYGNVNTGSYLEMAELWTKLGIPLKYTSSGRASFTADILAHTNHPVAKQILRMRSLDKLLNTFVDGQMVDLAYNGRLHPCIYTSKSDTGGTVTGRCSSQNPNGQNIPARADKFGKEIRSLFIPENDCILGAFDYKQIEYRVFSHFAIGEAGKHVQQAYQEREIDYHQFVQDMMGWTKPDDPVFTKNMRHVTKNLNFGALYGLGYRSFATKFHDVLLMSHPNVSEDELPELAKSLMDEYHEKIPFVEPTIKAIENTCKTRGFVKSVSGRRHRRPPAVGKGDVPYYKIVNYLCQGSAGEIIKKAIMDSWNGGVWSVLKSHMMVHDELVFSIPKTKEGLEAAEALCQYMKNAYQLKVPLGVDTEIGPDWGHCGEDHWNEFKEKYA